MAKSEYTEELNKYFHLSNSGLSAVLSKTTEESKYPHVKIELKTGTLGVMNTTLELIASSHIGHFMSTKELLELSAFFAEAARITNEVEIQSFAKSVQRWKDVQEKKDSDPKTRMSAKHWQFLESREKAILQKRLAQQQHVSSIAKNLQVEVDEFALTFYPKGEVAECDSGTAECDSGTCEQEEVVP